MRDRTALNAAFVTAQIERLKVAYPELADDQELLASAVEGETDFERVVERVAEVFFDTVTMKEALALRIKDLNERASRFDRKAEGARFLLLGLMSAAQVKSLLLPTATLSIREGGSRLDITDENAIPQGYVRIERSPMKADILKALKAGNDIPGARLVAAPDTLSVRTK